MKITQISLTNFRSFKDTQVIDLAPVTLMFGPNSAGKSSVFSALFYIQQILEKKQCDPMYIDVLNKKYVGGFKNLVHKRDLNSTIKIKIRYDRSNSKSKSYTYLYDLIEQELDIKLESPVKKTMSISTEFEIAWSHVKKTAYVKTYIVEFDDREIARVECEFDGQNPKITSLNYIHDLLWPKNHEDWKRGQKEQDASLHPYNDLVINGNDVYAEEDQDTLDRKHEKKIEGLKLKDKALLDSIVSWKLEEYEGPNQVRIAIDVDGEKAKTYYKQLFGDEPYDENKFLEFVHSELEGSIKLSFVLNSCYVSALHKLINTSKSDDAQYIQIKDFHEYEFLHNPIEIYDTADALPPLGKKLFNSLGLGDVKKSEIISELLSDVLVAPLDNLLELLKQSISIGPIRKIIDANYQPLPYIEQKDWFDGSAAWSYLEKAELDILKKINTWMIEEDKLNLGYGIALKKTESMIRTLDISKTDLVLDENKQLQIKVKDDSAFSSSISEKKQHYTIIDKYNHISVTPSEVGTGVSQLMPLIIAAVSQQGGIVGCEQPELHLHPRIQVAIADLLTQNIGKVNYLIETHSEHLILRLLKRIRQHTDKELPEGLNFIQKSDVAILYFEPTENGVIAHKIGIDEDGEFTGNWPHGFFSERRHELM